MDRAWDWFAWALTLCLPIAAVFGGLAAIGGVLGQRLLWAEAIAGWALLFWVGSILIVSYVGTLASIFHDVTGHRFARYSASSVSLNR